MTHKHASRRFLENFKKGESSPTGIIPLRPVRAMFKIQDPEDLKAITTFPKRVLIISLREVFQDCGRWQWKSGRGTNIYIHDQYPQLSEGESVETEKKSAIITSRGTIRKLYRDGRQNNGRISADNQLIQHSDLLSVDMTLNCVAEMPEEADELAGKVAAILVQNELVFKQRGVHAIPDGDR